MPVYIYRNGKFELIGDIEIKLLKATEEYKDAILVEADKRIENVDDFASVKKEELSQATDHYFYSQAKARGGYLNMGEIVHDAGEGDPDAQFLLKLYDAIWEKEEELESQLDSMSLEELLKIENMEAWVKPRYDQVVAELENTTDSTTDNTSEG